MGTLRSNLAPATTVVNLQRFADAEDRAWLVEALGSDRPTIEEIEELVAGGGLSRERFNVLLGIQQNVRGNVLAIRNTPAIDRSGVVGSLADMLLLPKTIIPKGAPPEMIRTYEAISTQLWGHEHLADSFVRFAKDHLSRTRPTVAVMAWAGAPGHGKDQAVDLFGRALFGDEVQQREPIDLAQMKDQHVSLLFGDGPLSKKALEAAAEKGAVVVLKNAHDTGNGGLKDRAPALARAVLELLLRNRNHPDFVRLPFVFDFDADGEADPRDLMIESLGPAASNILSARATFDRLDAPTMIRYANAAIPEMLSDEGMSGFVVRFDDPAEVLLGEALATPHAPLDWLRHRLQSFVFTHVDTHLSLDRVAGGLLEIGLSPDMLRPKERADLLADLHVETPDLEKGEGLFVARQIAVRDSDPEVRATNVRRVRELVAILDVELEHMREASESGGRPEVTKALESVERLHTVIAEASRRIDHRVKRGERDLIAEQGDGNLCEEIVRVSEALGALVALAGETGVPESLREHAVDLRDAFSERIRSIAALAGVVLEEEPELEALDPAQQQRSIEMARLFEEGVRELEAAFGREPAGDQYETKAMESLVTELDRAEESCRWLVARLDHRAELDLTQPLAPSDGETFLTVLSDLSQALDLYAGVRALPEDDPRLEDEEWFDPVETSEALIAQMTKVAAQLASIEEPS